MENQSIKQALQDIYHRLTNRYGPQRWWPAREAFEVIVGAILTQSTAWVNVEKAIANLRTAKALSPEALHRLPHHEVARLIYPCGYYNATLATATISLVSCQPEENSKCKWSYLWTYQFN
ncbi:hypothetical protein ACFLV5_03170 [Chloroflexota bacterium]